MTMQGSSATRHAALRISCLRARRLVPALILASLAGCASGGLVDMWRDPQPPKAPMRNVFIVAVKNDAVKRRLMEDSFAAALTKHGVTATPSYRLFPGVLPDTAQVVEAVRSIGYDGVLVASKLPTEVNRYDVPGYTNREPRTVYSSWVGRYYTYYVDVHHPGYTESEKIVRHRVDLWVTGDGGRLVWSAVGQSINPGSSSDVNHEITDTIVPELARIGLLPK